MNTQTISSYEQQAKDFAAKYGITLVSGTPQYKRHFVGEKEQRYVFPCKLSRNGKHYSFEFGQSIADGNKTPDLYSVLACLQKYDPGTSPSFCEDFGYEGYNPYTGKIHSLHNKIYKSVVKEWEDVNRLFGDILEELREIQ